MYPKIGDGASQQNVANQRVACCETSNDTNREPHYPNRTMPRKVDELVEWNKTQNNAQLETTMPQYFDP